MRRHELVPEEPVIPIRDTSSVLPAGKAGTSDARHRDWGDSCSLSGDGRGSCAMSALLAFAAN